MVISPRLATLWWTMRRDEVCSVYPAGPLLAFIKEARSRGPAGSVTK